MASICCNGLVRQCACGHQRKLACQRPGKASWPVAELCGKQYVHLMPITMHLQRLGWQVIKYAFRIRSPPAIVMTGNSAGQRPGSHNKRPLRSPLRYRLLPLVLRVLLLPLAPPLLLSALAPLLLLPQLPLPLLHSSQTLSLPLKLLAPLFLPVPLEPLIKTLPVRTWLWRPDDGRMFLPILSTSGWFTARRGHACRVWRA